MAAALGIDYHERCSFPADFPNPRNTALSPSLSLVEDRDMLDSPPPPASGAAGRGDSRGGDCPGSDSTAERSTADWDLARLIHEHHASLYRYAFRLAGNAADAEDLAQQTFVTAYEKLHQVRQAESVRGWLFAVLRNCFLKSRRRPRPLTGDAVEMDVQHLAVEPTGATPFDGELLRQALDALPDEFRLVLVMFYFEECSYKEISEKLEIPLGTVMSRLSRAKQRLRTRLQLHAEHADQRGHEPPPARPTPPVSPAPASTGGDDSAFPRA
jgi:RNA polymerase sigma-70 factor (ECF subfamily)